METLNLDLILPWNTMNRMLSELYKCQSANVNYVFDPDKIRIKQYVSAMRTQIDYISNKPGYLDLPETNPLAFPLKVMVSEQSIENDAISHLCQIIKLGMLEMVGSQSSRFSSGIADPDKTRIIGVLAKIENHTEAYINKELPLDYPESSPQAPLQGSGLGGIGNV